MFTYSIEFNFFLNRFLFDMLKQQIYTLLFWQATIKCKQLEMLLFQNLRSLILILDKKTWSEELLKLYIWLNFKRRLPSWILSKLFVDALEIQ